MNLVEKIQKDMIKAMKNQEKDRLTVIRMVKAGLKQEEIDHKREINDELVIDVVNKQIKMRNDSILEFEKAGRGELAQKNKEEIEVLKQYLPEQLTKEEVEKIIDEAFSLINPTGPKDMGKIMQEVTPKLKGRTDMREVSNIIKAKLN